MACAGSRLLIDSFNKSDQKTNTIKGLGFIEIILIFDVYVIVDGWQLKNIGNGNGRIGG